MCRRLTLVHDSTKPHGSMAFREALQRLQELGYRHLPAMEDGPGEVTKGDARGWRIAPGQQPLPSPDRRQGSTGTVPGSPEEADLDVVLAQLELGKLREALAENKITLGKLREALAETKIALAQAERDVSRREVELLRERLADTQAERDRLHALQRETLACLSLPKNLLRAVRGRARCRPGKPARDGRRRR